MKAIDEQIIKFIRKHHVMTLATVNDKGDPYCCSLFYAYIEALNLFVFTSSRDTAHGTHLSARRSVAANIVLETKVVGKIEGLQIEGEADSAQERPEIKSAYLKKYPFARFMEVDLWVLRPTTMKLTDNKLGFGKKIKWNAAAEGDNE